MDISEEIVQNFITANASAGDGVAFLCPQFEINDDGWKASADFVVLYFRPRGPSMILMVEVSNSGGLGSIATKADNYVRGDYRDRLRKQVTTLTNGLTQDWDVAFLGFVRTEELANTARGKFGSKAQDVHFASIEKAFNNGWWKTRELGLLPILEGES